SPLPRKARHYWLGASQWAIRFVVGRIGKARPLLRRELVHCAGSHYRMADHWSGPQGKRGLLEEHIQAQCFSGCVSDAKTRTTGANQQLLPITAGTKCASLFLSYATLDVLL